MMTIYSSMRVAMQPSAIRPKGNQVAERSMIIIEFSLHLRYRTASGSERDKGATCASHLDDTDIASQKLNLYPAQPAQLPAVDIHTANVESLSRSLPLAV